MKRKGCEKNSSQETREETENPTSLSKPLFWTSQRFLPAHADD